MTRAQDTSIYNTSTADNATNESTAQKAATAEQQGISDYSSSVAKLAANNPFQKGGQYASDQTQILSDASNAGTQALSAELQGLGRRTGTNPGAAVAATEAGAATNTRNLGTDMAESDASRIANEANYNSNVTNDTAKVPEMDNNLYSTAGSQANANESTALGASANNQSFGDQFGGAFATGLGKGLANIATGGNAGSGGSGGAGGASPTGSAYDNLDMMQAGDGVPIGTEDTPATGMIAFA